MTIIPRAAALTLTLSIVVALSPAAGAASSEPPKPPANDEVANAQALGALPASVEGTTVGATTVPGEAQSRCVGGTVSSVWYTVQTASAERVAVELAAGGKLDGTVDVYREVRSQLEPVACAQTEEEGKASLTFQAKKNKQYAIRVAALANSQLAPFTLNVFLPTPAATPPGPRLPAAGSSGQVDRIQNVNAAWSFTMRAGVSYLINLANETRGACVDGALFGPGTRSFEGASARLRVNCGGYRLFTPGPGRGGVYTFEVTPSPEVKGEQRYHLQITAASGAQTAPGRELANYGRVSAHLQGTGVDVLRLYRMYVSSHSNLALRLSAPPKAEFDLQLRDQNGNLLACACEGGGSRRLAQQVHAGHYYVVVSVRNHTSGTYTLTRESRTITRTTRIAFGARHGVAGRPVAIDVHVTPASATGLVKVEVQRFDPVFGWQYYGVLEGPVNDGLAAIAFTPPTPGNWRAKAAYTGSRVASPSAIGYTYLFVD